MTAVQLQQLKDAFNADYDQQAVTKALDMAFGSTEQDTQPSMVTIDYATDPMYGFPTKAKAANITHIKHIRFYDNKNIYVFDITLDATCTISRTRENIKKLVTKLIAPYSNAILLFHYADTTNQEWRISWITKGSGNTHTNAAKRYTFLCGKMHPARTIVDRLSNIDASKNLADEITKAFSVEALSDEFFAEYKAFYEDIVQYICGARYVKGKGKDNNKYVRTQIEDEATIVQRGLFTKFVEQAIKENSELSKPIDATKTPEEQKKAKETQEKKQIEEDAEKLVRNYVKKLLGRLVFIQFLSKKGWMGLKPTDAWGAGNEHFLHNIYDDSQKNRGNGNFVGDVLNKVLFYSLNNTTGVDGNVAICSNNIAGTNYKFPYLNGGLFEVTELDNLGINLPGYFFVSDNIAPNGREYADDDAKAPKNTTRKFIETVKKNSKKKNGEESESANGYPYSSSEGLFEFFSRYNFTIDENGSDEAVVGIDPEMLGKIFENLLEDNKDKGAFYTPKPVVEYMCQQSLIAYLQNGILKEKEHLHIHLSDEEIKWQIEQFVKTKNTETISRPSRVNTEDNTQQNIEHIETQRMSDELKRLLLQKLETVKICDPAIGSGAFPMGLLNELLACREALESSESSQGANGQHKITSRAELKKQIIQNNIYGVDIEEGAIEIARLRFWLSIVIELDKPEPLPNFDFKFMQGNSLLEWYEGIDLRNIVAMKKKRKCEVSCDLFGKVEGIDKDTIYLSDTMFDFDLQKAIKDYFDINDHTKKQEQKAEIDEYLKCVICHTLSVKAVELNGTINNLKAVDNLKPKQQKVLEEKEAEYNRLQDIIKNFHSAICDKFFLWHLWFKDVFDMGGFDIVIGNPPYGATLSDEDKEFFKEHYITAKTIKANPKKNIVGQKGSLNTYTLFIELAYRIGGKNGSVSMIVPLSITSSKSVDVTQKWIFNNCRDFHVSSYAVRPQPVFKNAVVDVSIISFMKGVGSDNKIYSTKMYRKSKKDEKFSLQNLIDNLEFTDVQDHLLLGRIPKIGKEIEKGILAKLKKNAQPLSAYIVDEDKGLPVYYRSAGGRYYKVVTPYSTYSSAETSITVDSNMRDCICCILSSSLSFWFYQIYSDNLNWKPYEILEMRIPYISDDVKQQIEALYQIYLADIKKNANTCVNHGGNSYKVPTFDVYHIRKSLPIIDEIDDLIGPLYGLTPEEIDFIKNYERTFREDDDEDENNEAENRKPKNKKK